MRQSCYVGKGLSKKEQKTNWAKRPLSLDQLAYAVGDSYAILLIFKEMMKRIPNLDCAARNLLEVPRKEVKKAEGTKVAGEIIYVPKSKEKISSKEETAKKEAKVKENN